jgi:hypothetical protein
MNFECSVFIFMFQAYYTRRSKFSLFVYWHIHWDFSFLMQNTMTRIQKIWQNVNIIFIYLAFLNGWKEVTPVLYVIRFGFYLNSILTIRICLDWLIWVYGINTCEAGRAYGNSLWQVNKPLSAYFHKLFKITYERSF